MNLYIQIENGQPVNHPAFEDNLIEAFGVIPDNWKPFARIEQPLNLLTSPFQTTINTYTLSSDGITWKDTWTALEMTENEKAELIKNTQAKPPFTNAILDTITLQWSKPSKPIDGKNYTFDFDTGTWVILDTPDNSNIPIT